MKRAGADNVVNIGLSAAIVSVAEERPRVLVVHRANETVDSLPFGPFDPLHHRTLESGLRSWVGEQTSLDIGYVEQLYTFGDRGRHQIKPAEELRVVSVGYLALTRGEPKTPDTQWREWYRFFPWEDWRDARPRVIDEVIAPAMRAFAKSAGKGDNTSEARRDRARLCFGLDGLPWDEEKVLDRYELLYEAGLVEESVRDGRVTAVDTSIQLGAPMMFDHRRILATAIARLRGKMKYRPVVFELMPPTFTLLELQRTVEAISGVRLHKQNFRRLVEDQGLVEGTGRTSAAARGRPAELFRFRKEVLRERPAPGFRLGMRAR
ncbi:MAG TPA: hypothetical protein VMS78_06155 [Rhizomicrobium sp.]|nr:hypothetical protein [Rhizomicrobium sp.]